MGQRCEGDKKGQETRSADAFLPLTETPRAKGNKHHLVTAGIQETAQSSGSPTVSRLNC